MKLLGFLSQQNVAKEGFKGVNAPKDGEKYNAAQELAKSLPTTGGDENQLNKIAAMARMTP